MAHWDYTTGRINVAPPVLVNSEWINYDCGCSSGLEWGGEYPRECSQCQGTGALSVHIKSGTIALYPGGPLSGKMPKVQLALVLLSAYRARLDQDLDSAAQVV